MTVSEEEKRNMMSPEQKKQMADIDAEIKRQRDEARETSARWRAKYLEERDGRIRAVESAKKYQDRCEYLERELAEVSRQVVQESADRSECVVTLAEIEERRNALLNDSITKRNDRRFCEARKQERYINKFGCGQKDCDFYKFESVSHFCTIHEEKLWRCHKQKNGEII